MITVSPLPVLCGSRTVPNKPVEPTPYSVRCAPASGRGSPPALSIIHILGTEPRVDIQLLQCASRVTERSMPRSDWIEAELAECQMRDARHTKRLARLLSRLSARPVRSMPTACHGWAETRAAYRFLTNPDMSTQEIVSGHTHATLERIRTQEVVLLVQDTTFLHDGTTQPKAGLGTVKLKTCKKSLFHPTVAFTPERVN